MENTHYQEKENVWLGVLGAFLFSLIGAAVYFLLNAMKLNESIGGFISVFCALHGYVIFAKKESKKGIIISLVIATVIIILSWYFCFCIATVNQYNIEASKLPESQQKLTSLGEFLPHSFDVLADHPQMFIYLGLSLLFGLFGYLSYAFRLFSSDKPKNRRR